MSGARPRPSRRVGIQAADRAFWVFFFFFFFFLNIILKVGPSLSFFFGGDVFLFFFEVEPRYALLKGFLYFLFWGEPLQQIRGIVICQSWRSWPWDVLTSTRPSFGQQRTCFLLCNIDEQGTWVDNCHLVFP